MRDRPPHREPTTLFEQCVGFFTSHRIIYEELWDGAHSSSLSLFADVVTKAALSFSTELTGWRLAQWLALNMFLLGELDWKSQAQLIKQHWGSTFLWRFCLFQVISSTFMPRVVALRDLPVWGRPGYTSSSLNCTRLTCLSHILFEPK